MVTTTSLCTDCAEPVTNPVCPICFSKHVINWARDKNIKKREMQRIRKGLRELVIEAEETPSETSCIICNAEKTSICNHCFMRRSSFVISRNVRKIEIKDFDNLFNVHSFFYFLNAEMPKNTVRNRGRELDRRR